MEYFRAEVIGSESSGALNRSSRSPAVEENEEIGGDRRRWWNVVELQRKKVTSECLISVFGILHYQFICNFRRKLHSSSFLPRFANIPTHEYTTLAADCACEDGKWKLIDGQIGDREIK